MIVKNGREKQVRESRYRLDRVAKGGADTKVLLIVDDPSLARILRFSLQSAGFETAEFKKGMAAIRFLENQHSDAVVLDLELGDSHGSTVLEWLKHKSAMADGIPVWIAMSTLDQEEAVQRYGPIGAHFLAKPFDPWDLVARLEEELSANVNR